MATGDEMVLGSAEGVMEELPFYLCSLLLHLVFISSPFFLQDLQQVMVSGPNLNETSIVSGGYGGTAEAIIPTSTIKGKPSRCWMSIYYYHLSRWPSPCTAWICMGVVRWAESIKQWEYKIVSWICSSINKCLDNLMTNLLFIHNCVNTVIKISKLEVHFVKAVTNGWKSCVKYYFFVSASLWDFQAVKIF